MTATVATSDLLVRYRTAVGTVTALDHHAFVIDGGTSVAVMGPSGCGKSTLLGLLAGLAVPTRGTVTVGELVLSDLSERARVRFRRSELGMVYQADNLLPHLTVEENVALPLAIAGRVGDDPSDLLGRLGLGGLARRFPDQLSGGQRQRVAVARAVVGRPHLILADEPTGSLDDRSAGDVIELLVDVQRDLGATLVLVTHDPVIAAHADRVEHIERPASTSGGADVD
jgi:putative ABC transport system ATP-binding protein